jgi:crotonobetainyl-CoA:carnitine CoA-transferase CaiB-like acyl-CoA transferase
MSVTGQRDGSQGAGPVRVGASVVDVATGMNAAFAIMVALRHRDATGEGQHLDVALFDTGVALQADNVQKFILSGDLIGRHGSENYGGAPARIFDTADGSVFIMAGISTQFRALCNILDCPELVADPRFADVASRFRHRDALTSLLQPRIARLSSAHLIAALEAASVPCSQVRNYQEVFDDPHTHARSLRVAAPHPKSDRLQLIASPIKCSATPARYQRPPALGEHTEEILSQTLGLGAAEIAELRDSGVI